MITRKVLRGMGKDKEVVELLEYLPYLRDIEENTPQVAPWAKMMNWQQYCLMLSRNGRSADEEKLISEGRYQDDVPSSVVGITDTGPTVECFLLDIEQGAIYWPGCNSNIMSSPTMLADDPYEYCENIKEADWRSEGAWAISDFFEMLKQQYTELVFIPVSMEKVLAAYDLQDEEEMVARLQQVYRDHRWPDLNLYRKEECLRAVQKLLVEHYPDYTDQELLADERDDDGE